MCVSSAAHVCGVQQCDVSLTWQRQVTITTQSMTSLKPWQRPMHCPHVVSWLYMLSSRWLHLTVSLKSSYMMQQRSLSKCHMSTTLCLLFYPQLWLKCLLWWAWIGSAGFIFCRNPYESLVASARASCQHWSFASKKVPLCIGALKTVHDINGCRLIHCCVLMLLVKNHLYESQQFTLRDLA